MPDLEQDFPGREVYWNGKRKEENYVRKNQRNYSRIIRSRRRNNYRGDILKENLGADSLDLFEMVMAFEEAFEVEIPSEDLEQIQTVGDVVKYLEAHK